MKILQANKFFFKNGGSETVMFQERDYLLSQGHQVVDFSMEDQRNYPSEQAPYFVENRSYRSGGIAKLKKLAQTFSFVHSPEAVRKISQLITDQQPDLVHCHNIYHQLTPSIIGVAKKMGVPVVLTLHDYKAVCPTYNRLQHDKPCSECLNGDFFNVVKHRCADGSLGKSALLYIEAVAQRWMENYEKVDAYIAPSDFMKEAISHRIPAERIALLRNGIDINQIEVSQQDAQYVLYLGRLSREKGVKTLLDAYDSANGAWPLKVVGTGPLLDDLKVKYDPSILIGYLTGGALTKIIQCASIVVVPSEWYENCPMSILEAMAYGKPVVAANIGGIPEIVQNGETGLLFEPGDVLSLVTCINRLMQDPKLRKRLGNNGRQRVESQFSLVRHNQMLISIYNKVLGV